MHLNRLRALIAVIDCGSFSRAARLLGLSQPAISQQVKALEDDLGATLVERHVEPVRATPAGATAYKHAKSILTLWQQMESEVRTLQGRAMGRLCIGASTVPATYLLPAIIGRFRRENPSIDVAVEVSDSDTVREWVLTQRVDVGAVGARRDDRRLVYRPIGEDELLLITPCSHPWAQAGSVTPRQLSGASFVMRERGSGTRRAMEAALWRWGVNPASLHVALEAGSTEAVVAAVEAGLGVSFVSHWAVRPALALGRVCSVRVEGDVIRRRFYVVYRRHGGNTGLVHRFLQLVNCDRPPQACDDPMLEEEIDHAAFPASGSHGTVAYVDD